MNIDVMIIGAGSAGSTLGGLMSASGSRRVLLVEAGEDYRSNGTPPEIRGPNFADAVRLGRFHWPQLLATISGLREPEVYLCGKGVGGSSAINTGGASRGCKEDFARWSQSGCTGWSWEDVLPSFVAIENDHDFEAPYHGKQGPLPVVRMPESEWGMVSRGMKEAASAYHPWSADINAPDSTGLSPAAWNRAAGARVSTNDAYLEPARDRSSLQIAAQSFVERLLFSGSRVIGAELLTPEGRRTVTADEVIVCAGAIQSAALLLRSGIGPADDLRRLGIPLVADLPGVGKNLQDHPMAFLSFPLLPEACGSTPALPTSCVLRFGRDGQAHHRNEMQIMPFDRIPFAWDAPVGGMLVSFLRPASRGQLSLVSPDPASSPAIDFRMMSETEDVLLMIQAIRHAGELARAASLSRFMAAGLMLSPELPLDSVNDEELADWLRRSCIPHYHAAGTCRMGPDSDPGAVVDLTAHVRGVKGLRVIDTSIMPDLPTAPTHMTTVMLAAHLHNQESRQV